MANSSKDEPKTAPQSDRWYDLVLGPSFKEDSSNKYCTLRYEFKPASIDKSKPGTLQKNKDNRVSVEFQNNQVGKPKVTFEGSSEDYKENDAVLFFDGETFRLERLHRAVKQLRHLRMPGESAAAAQSALPMEPRLSPVDRGAKPVHVQRSLVPTVPVQVERIEIGNPVNPGAKANGKGIAGESTDSPNLSGASPAHNHNEDGEENQEIDFDEIFGACTPDHENTEKDKGDTRFDVNVPQQHQDIDEEIADVDDSGDEGEKVPNAADALRAQVNAEEQKGQSSSSSSSSGSGSSASESGGKSSSSSGSSSGSDGSDDDSINSV